MLFILLVYRLEQERFIAARDNSRKRYSCDQTEHIAFIDDNQGKTNLRRSNRNDEVSRFERKLLKKKNYFLTRARDSHMHNCTRESETRVIESKFGCASSRRQVQFREHLLRQVGQRVP